MSNNEIVPDFDESNDDFQIGLERIPGENGSIILHLKGYVDRYVFQYFNRQVDKVLRNNFRKLIFDCQELVNESGDGIIGGTLLAARELRKIGGDVVLSNVNEKYFVVLQQLGINKVVRIARSTDEAVALLREKGIGKA